MDAATICQAAKKVVKLPLEAVRVALGPKAIWNAFAASCNATYQCSHGYVCGEMMRSRVCIVAVYLDGRRIAQCAVSYSLFHRRQIGRFLDALQLLPEYQWAWSDVMAAVLAVLGPSTYRYGSKWNIERPRAADFAALPGAQVESAVRYQVQVVDFSQWSTWEAYEKAISSNAKRNAAKALKSDPATYVSLYAGTRAVPYFWPIVRMRSSLRKRKGLNSLNSNYVAAVRYIARTLLMRERSYTARVTHVGRVVAYFSGIDFGNDTYYLDGASLPENGGAAWLLILKMMRRAWKPNGKVFISMYEHGIDWAGKDNIMRSRQHLRVKEYPNDVVSFQYKPTPYNKDQIGWLV